MEGGKSKQLLRIELNVFVLMYLLFKKHEKTIKANRRINK